MLNRRDVVNIVRGGAAQPSKRLRRNLFNKARWVVLILMLPALVWAPLVGDTQSFNNNINLGAAFAASEDELTGAEDLTGAEEPAGTEGVTGTEEPEPVEILEDIVETRKTVSQALREWDISSVERIIIDHDEDARNNTSVEEEKKQQAKPWYVRKTK